MKFLGKYPKLMLEMRYPLSRPSDGLQIHALLIAGSNGIQNYRHQADLAHSYHLLLDKGVPAGNIVVMMYDDIANNPR